MPYEKQADPQDGRMCGAAALSMVYRSLGLPVTQREVWPKIARHNFRGSLAGSAHLIIRDALDRGLAALGVQARNPVQVLRRCQEAGVRAVLNHRLAEDVSTGHFTVLVEVGKDDVVVHDPHFGPSRHVRQPDLLDLWRPRYLNSEIVGNVLIGIAPRGEGTAACAACQTPIPATLLCPGCGQPIPLRPAALLGCMRADCPARQWDGICCPFCDQIWRDSTGAASVQPAQTTTTEAEAIDRAFAELDKVLAFVMSQDHLARRSDVQQQVKFLQSRRPVLQEALEQRDVQLKQRQAGLERLQQQSEKQSEALEQAMAAKPPAPPPDGNALGMALVKDLGLVPVEPAPLSEKKPTTPAGKKAFPPLHSDQSFIRKALRKVKKSGQDPGNYDSLKPQ
jgi:hypothetical protein